MNNIMQMIKNKIEEFKQYDQNQKTIILAAFALVISTLAVFTVWFNRVDYRPLYENLSMKDASEITKILKDKKIEYKLEDQGTKILVPESQVYQLRLELAEEGLPKNGHIGYEIFDKTDLQVSEFTENIKYIRALQDELEASINQLKSVESCQVNITIPKDRVYLNDEYHVTASVMLNLRRGAGLTDEQVQGIAQLVSGCVEGMNPRDVTIMSSDGRLLSDFLQNEGFGATTFQMKARLQAEKNLENAMRSLLESVLGPGKAVVKVNIEMKFDQKKVQKIVYQPLANNTGVVRSSQVLSEGYTDSSNTNTPLAPTEENSEIVTTNTTGTKGPKYNQQSTITNYEISKVLEDQVISPGEIKKISIGVIVDTQAGLTPQQIQDLKDVIEQSSGIDPKRGDMVSIKSLAFYQEPEPPEEKPNASVIYKQYEKFIIPGFFLLVMIIFFIMMTRMKAGGRKVKELESPQAGHSLPAPMPDMIPAGMGGEPGMTPMLDTSSSAPANPEMLDSDAVRNTIRDFARNNPKVIANIMEKWIME